ncbi:MAG: M20/M25/M40 family metallo-hydrolase [Thermoflexales bacterium]|nr:M20/M25/M40 family metallo-hydrolase [Thermoflexales bacterium]
MDINSFDRYLTENRERLLEDYKDFLRQPSVAATGEGMAEMAALVARRLAGLGATVELSPTAPGAPPVVWAELGDGPRTLLIYNHYDVQPAEPLDLWESPPWEPTLREGKLFARGALDDKGELVTRIHAIEAWLKTQGPLPCRIKWLIEGEEEISSPHLHDWVARHREKVVGADGCLWEFGGFDEEGRPEHTLGVKGICYVELHASAVSHDLHSSMAALAPNAAWRLIWALNTIKGPDEKILIDHYYDAVRAPTEAELAVLRELPFDAAREAALKDKWGVGGFVTGVEGFDAIKRLYFQPTATVCGVSSGWEGAGAKTVLPARAMCKIDFRLVPDLTPEIVVDLLRKHLDRRGFQDIEIRLLGGYRSALSDVNAPVVKAAARAAERVYGRAPVRILLSPGSGPMWTLSEYIGGVPVVCAGIGHPDSRVHSPNEHVILANYERGMRFIGALIDEFARP